MRKTATPEKPTYRPRRKIGLADLARVRGGGDSTTTTTTTSLKFSPWIVKNQPGSGSI